MASNKLIHPWIASFVEHCLRFYIGEISDSGIEVDDYEGCLRFHMRQSSYQALIAEVRYSFIISDLARLMKIY